MRFVKMSVIVSDMNLLSDMNLFFAFSSRVETKLFSTRETFPFRDMIFSSNENISLNPHPRPASPRLNSNFTRGRPKMAHELDC